MSEHEKQSLVQNEENRDGYGANSETEVCAEIMGKYAEIHVHGLINFR